MRKLSKVPEIKPLRNLNKSVSSIQSITQSTTIPSSKTIESDTSIKHFFDREQLTLIAKEQTETIESQMREMKQQILKLSETVYQQRCNNQTVINNLREQLIQTLQISRKQEILSNPRQSIPLSTTNTNSKNINQLQQSISLIFERLDTLAEQNTSLRAMYPANQPQVTTQDIEQVQIQLHGVSQQIHKQMALIRDCLLDMGETMDNHINTVGNKTKLLDIEKTLSELTDKVNAITLYSQKQNNEIQKIQRQIDLHQTLIQKYQYRETKQRDTLTSSINQVKQCFELQSRELEQFLCQRLGKMIQSYNNNFEQMDRSIIELKETIREVLYLNKFISENIGQKLKNTIDNNTFHQTIATLNQKFSETHQLNYNKIVQLNTKEYQVQNELSYMKTMLENLKMDFKQNYNTQKLDEDMSLQSSRSPSLQQSKNISVQGGKKFMRPNFVFPQRDSFNFNQERKRKSIGVDEVRRLTLKIDKDY